MASISVKRSISGFSLIMHNAHSNWRLPKLKKKMVWYCWKFMTKVTGNDGIQLESLLMNVETDEKFAKVFCFDPCIFSEPEAVRKRSYKTEITHTKNCECMSVILGNNLLAECVLIIYYQELFTTSNNHPAITKLYDLQKGHADERLVA